MRVLCVGNLYPPHDFGGGYEVTWRSSVAQLRARGDSVRVLTTDHRGSGLDPAAELDAEVHRQLRWYWRDHDFPRLGWRERIALERHNAAVLDRHLADFAPDVVAWWGMGGMSLGLVERVRRAGLPAIGVVGDEWMVWGPRADRWQRAFRGRPRLGGLAERVTGLPASIDIGGAATWLFNSAAVRERSLEAGWALPRSEIAHPGIDDELFRPAEPRPWRWRLLYLGRLDPRKGVDTAVAALEHLPAEATLLLQGSGDAAYERELRERAKRSAVAGRVEWSAAGRDRIPALYADADAVLFPVRWEEPWGLVPLEAMAVGRPVVASGTGGSREYLRHEDNCLIYEPRESAQALAAAVERLAGDAALRERLRAGGLVTAARHTERGYNEAIAAALDRAVAGDSRPARESGVVR